MLGGEVEVVDLQCPEKKCVKLSGGKWNIKSMYFLFQNWGGGVFC